VEERLLARGILLRVDEAALDFLADRGFDPAYGEGLRDVQFSCVGLPDLFLKSGQPRLRPRVRCGFRCRAVQKACIKPQ
jgi:C-terminal, D2-small domain, of ClpB protein